MIGGAIAGIILAAILIFLPKRQEPAGPQPRWRMLAIFAAIVLILGPIVLFNVLRTG